ncbi:MAG: hypothetical protein PHN56_06950 [Candidatus Nanoarchaeia archaeon]|nr:hypothetical protein [Candidatus Nanoarchaeia archaeon]
MITEETLYLLSNIFDISEKISIISCVVIFILDKIEIYDEYDNNYEIIQFSYIFQIIYLILHGIIGSFYRNPSFTYLLINCILVNLINIYLLVLLLRGIKILLAFFKESLEDKYYKINFNKSREIKKLNEEFDKYQEIKNEKLEKINELEDRIDEIDFFIQDDNIWLNKINSVSSYIKQKNFHQAALKMYLAGFSYYQRFNVDSLNSDFFYFLFQSTRLYYFDKNYENGNFLLGNISKSNKQITLNISDKSYTCNTLFSFMNITDEGEKIRRGLLIGVMLIEVHMEKKAIEVIIPCKNLLEKTIGSDNDIIRKLNTLIKNTYSDMDIVNYRFDDLTKTFLETFNQFKLEQSLFMQKILRTLNDYKADVDSRFSQMDAKLSNLSSDLRSGLSTIDCNLNSLSKNMESNYSSMNSKFDSTINKIDKNSQTIQSIYNKFY